MRYVSGYAHAEWSMFLGIKPSISDKLAYTLWGMFLGIKPPRSDKLAHAL